MSRVVPLTHNCRSAKEWKGPLPEDMLAKLWTPGLMHDRAMPAMQCEVGTVLMHPAFLCSTACGSGAQRRVHACNQLVKTDGRSTCTVRPFPCRWWRRRKAQGMWPL